MPDPGETPAPAASADRLPPTRTMSIMTAGGATIAVSVTSAQGRWTCNGCGDSGLDTPLDALVGAGNHAGQCGRATLSSRLTAEVAAVRTELQRVDTKASIWLAVAGAMLTVLIPALGRRSVPAFALIVGLAAAAGIVAAAGLLALASRPVLNGHHGFVRHADAGDAEVILSGLATDPFDPQRQLREDANQLRFLAKAVKRKFRRVRHAIDVLVVAGAASGAAGLVAVVITKLS